MVTAQERAILRKAAEITRAKNRERRQKIKADRKPGGKQHRGRERDNGFLAYLRRQPCEAAGFGMCGGPIQAAHIRYRQAGIANSAGTSVKNHDRHANPLCAEHHAMQHNCGDERRFWSMIGKDAYATASTHFSTYKNDPADGAGR